MRYFALIILGVFCSMQFCFAQNTTQAPKYYYTWIKFQNDSSKFEGILYELQDSSILVANSLVVKNYPDGKYGLTKIYVPEIYTVKTRRTKSVGRGIVIGTVTGFAIGGVIGLVGGDDAEDALLAWTAGEKALVSGIFLGGVGALTGWLLGSIKVKFEIKGNLQNYERQRNKIRKYSLKYNSQ